MGNYYSLKLHSMTDKFIYLNQLLIKNENFKQYIIEKSPMCVFVLKKKNPSNQPQHLIQCTVL